jgi:hypothetical protein
MVVRIAKFAGEFAALAAWTGEDPLFLLDVDGVLNPYAAPSTRPKGSRARLSTTPCSG